MKKVLSVEDNQFNQMLLEKIMDAFNIEQIHMVDVASTRKYFASKDIPDLVLMDLGLPDGSGFDLIEDMKNSNEYKDIPIIIITAHATSDVRKRSDELKVDHFLSKPIGVKELKELLVKFLGQEIFKESA